MVNYCKQDVWIANMNPDIPMVMKLRPNGQDIYHQEFPNIPMASLRWWPKMGCNEDGYKCLIGDSAGVFLMIAWRRFAVCSQKVIVIVHRRLL